MILSSQWQLKTLASSEEIFIDGTFYTAPKPFKQVLNIISYNKLAE